MLKICVFAYDFPHRKSTDFLLEISKYDPVSMVIAAPYEKLMVPESQERIAVRGNNVLDPCDVAGLLNIPYVVVPHRSERCLEILRKRNFDVGMVAGARILPKSVIDCFRMGIVNLHPGLLPENRGLDNIKWAVYLNLPQYVTAHYINEKVDSGNLICKEVVDVALDDTWFDMNNKVYAKQVEMLGAVLSHVHNSMDFPVLDGGEQRSAIPRELEIEAYLHFEEYKQRYHQIKERYI